MNSRTVAAAPLQLVGRLLPRSVLQPGKVVENVIGDGTQIIRGQHHVSILYLFRPFCRPFVAQAVLWGLWSNRKVA